MRHFAIFYTSQQRPDGTQFFQEKFGSDGVAYMDNRHNLASMMHAARTIGTSRKAIANLAGFRIARGSHLSRLHYLNAAVQPL